MPCRRPVLAVLLFLSGALPLHASETPPAGLDAGDWGQMLASIRASEYEASRVGGGWQAPNREQDFRVHFTGAGVELVPRRQAEPSWRFGMDLVAWGASGETRAVRPSEPEVEGNRVSHRRGGGLVEWFVNGASGLEHGFTVERAPQGGCDLVFEFELRGGFSTEVLPGGVKFRGANGVSLRYAGLEAWDASGRRLAAAMGPSNGGTGLTITVATRDADYPLTIDPTFTQETKLLPEIDPDQVGALCGTAVAVDSVTGLAAIGCPQYDSSGGDEGAVFIAQRSSGPEPFWLHGTRLTASNPFGPARFGSSLALSGSTLIVGADLTVHSGLYGAGAAYVFVRELSGLWIEQQVLTASDAAQSDLFGNSVSLSGETALVGAFGDASNAGSAYVFTRTAGVWSEQQKLFVADAEAFDFFGSSVAISGDTALVGAYRDREGQAGEGAGSAYVFTRTGGDWTQVAQLLASDGAGGDLFGTSVALEVDTAVIGASDPIDAGAAYVFRRDAGGVWTEVTKLAASDGEVNDSFGVSVALSGNAVLVGALNDAHSGALGAGSAYLFSDDGGWIERQKLTAADATDSDRFGTSVALSADLALVGAAADDHSGGSDAGSAYVFARNAAVWNQEWRLAAADDARFGISVAVSGDTALVGAYRDDTFRGTDSGTAYVFVRSGGTWAIEQQLEAFSGPFDNFGLSVALSGDTALVGAVGNDHAGGSEAGAAYVFQRSGDSWVQQQKLTAGDAAPQDFFGVAVALSGETALVGAYGADNPGEVDSGAVYAFLRSGNVWSEQQRLTASDATGGDLFGLAVAVSGDTALIGAEDDNEGGQDAGAAYVFVQGPGGWTEEQKLTAADGEAFDLFGDSVAVDGDTALVGAPLDDHVAGQDAGSAYVFTRNRGVWSQQQKLTASKGEKNDLFGLGLALAEDVALVGSSFDDNAGGVDAGAVYQFVRRGGVWSERQILTASDATPGDRFGAALALSAGTAIVGAHLDGDGFGSAYAFEGIDGSFFALTPCRIVDTRNAVQGPALEGGVIRTVPFAGVCGVPPWAKAVAVNVTVTQPTVGGSLVLYEAGTSSPGTSNISFKASANRANNGVVRLSVNGAADALAFLPGGTVHLIIDVVGYFD